MVFGDPLPGSGARWRHDDLRRRIGHQALGHGGGGFVNARLPEVEGTSGPGVILEKHACVTNGCQTGSSWQRSFLLEISVVITEFSR
jgi:hypothetical protein